MEKRELSMLEAMLEGGRLVRDYRCPGDEGESLEEATEIDDSLCQQDATVLASNVQSDRTLSAEGRKHSGTGLSAGNDDRDEDSVGKTGRPFKLSRSGSGNQPPGQLIESR
eukprot:CAMPEP_0176147506 /NCGR_PEP_ID=MMETSP0120_2-20121206/75196_1 /TAXON_ID=160619 /ORGANISM="Kryptoperidinium foliaceum, Strain CCMP 1326" /LENGTH=110 /DNA_ID=CAMNT_0017484125 /DNA_START=146 /DNA_END=475 /DNA_ORIENTATION=-